MLLKYLNILYNRENSLKGGSHGHIIRVQRLPGKREAEAQRVSERLVGKMPVM